MSPELQKWQICYFISIRFRYPSYYEGREHHDDDCWSFEESSYPQEFTETIVARNIKDALEILIFNFKDREVSFKKAQEALTIVTRAITIVEENLFIKEVRCNGLRKRWKSDVEPKYIWNKDDYDSYYD